MKKGRKKSKKAPVVEKRRERQAPNESTDAASDQGEHSFDFGGIPPRDLKKNLGCG